MLRKYYIPILALLFIIVWAWSWWHPADPANWMLENRMVFWCLPVVIWILWHTKLSRTSTTLIVLFLMLHIIGAHYNYGYVPFGVTVGHIFGFSGNPYDKIVHFSFGLLIAYPIYELLLHLMPTKKVWDYVISFHIILAWSAVYEIFEWLSVANIDPHLGYLFIGGNDPFDTPKDMAVAGLGALIALGFIAIIKRSRK